MTYEQQTSHHDLHAMPAARKWVIWLCATATDSEPFAITIDVPAGYLGQGEHDAIDRHLRAFYPDHFIGEMWPTN